MPCHRREVSPLSFAFIFFTSSAPITLIRMTCGVLCLLVVSEFVIFKLWCDLSSGKTEKIQVTNKHIRIKEETDSNDSEFWMLKSSSGSELES